MEPSQNETQYAGEVSRTTVHCLWKVSGNCVYNNYCIQFTIKSIHNTNYMHGCTVKPLKKDILGAELLPLFGGYLLLVDSFKLPYQRLIFMCIYLYTKIISKLRNLLKSKI